MRLGLFPRSGSGLRERAERVGRVWIELLDSYTLSDNQCGTLVVPPPRLIPRGVRLCRRRVCLAVDHCLAA